MPKLLNALNASIWAVIDQGLFALSHFILNILLVRLLGGDAYGAFAISFTVYLLALTVYSSLVTEPMLVLGSGRFEKKSRGYLFKIIKGHWRFAWPSTFLILVFVSFFWINTKAYYPLLCAALMSGPMLFLMLVRRACYIPVKPKYSAEGGVIYFILILSTIGSCSLYFDISAFSSLLLIGLSSLITGTVIYWRLRTIPCLGDESPPSDRDVYSAHWTYGKWALVTALVGWLPGNISMLILPAWGGEAASGELRAANNLILPVQQLLAAAGPLLLPYFVRNRESIRFRKTVYLTSLAFMVPPACWMAILALYGDYLTSLIYGSSLHLSKGVLVILAGQASVSAAVLVIATALRALEVPKLAFWGYAGSCAMTVFFGIPLTLVYGIMGAVSGILISVVFNAIIITALTIKHFSRLQSA